MTKLFEPKRTKLGFSCWSGCSACWEEHLTGKLTCTYTNIPALVGVGDLCVPAYKEMCEVMAAEIAVLRNRVQMRGKNKHFKAWNTQQIFKEYSWVLLEAVEEESN